MIEEGEKSRMPPLEGKLEVPSILDEIRGAEDTILEGVARYGYGEHDRFAVQLALEEALSNAIHHGNRNDPSRHVKIEFRITAESVTITVVDEGAGFRPDTLPDPTTDENLRKPTGRGVMLMRVYMSEVRFNEMGNQVTMIKRRTKTGASQTQNVS